MNRPHFLFSILLLPGLAACSQTDAPLPLETLSVDPDALNIGDVYTSEFERNIPVTNRSSRTVTISDVTGTCACTSISPRQFSVAPGSTEHLRVEFNLAGKSGPFSIGLNSRLADGGLALTWNIRGRVRSFFRTDMPSPMVRFDYPGTVATIPLELAERVGELSVSTNTPSLNASVRVIDTSADVELHLADDAPFGARTLQLRFTGVDFEQQRYDVVVPLRIERVAPYVLRPKILNLGKVPRGGTAESTVLLASEFGFENFSLSSTPDGITVTPDASQDQSSAGKNLVLKVRIADARQGLQSVQAVAKAMIGPKEVPITLHISYFGE